MVLDFAVEVNPSQAIIHYSLALFLLYMNFDSNQNGFGRFLFLFIFNFF